MEFRFAPHFSLKAQGRVCRSLCRRRSGELLLSICIFLSLSASAVPGYAGVGAAYTAMSSARPRPVVSPKTWLIGMAGKDSPYPDQDSADLPRRIFAPKSFWYTPIPTDAPLHPNSEYFVREFLRQLRTYYGTVGINTNSYSSPIYFVGHDVAPVSVAQWDCHKPSYRDRQLDEMWRSVPIPPYAQPADGADSEMTIYQPSTDSMWEFWLARKVNGRWEACWGGRMSNVSKTDGIWPPHYGADATGLPFMGGQITVEELRRGAINHVIGIALVDAENWDIYSWPANRSDGYNPSHVPNQIPEGIRFRLDPTINIDALKINPTAKVIAKAAQIYGFVVWDRAGAICLRAENPKRFTTVGLPDPYPAIWNDTPTYEILADFPWDKLQFLPMNYGRP